MTLPFDPLARTHRSIGSGSEGPNDLDESRSLHAPFIGVYRRFSGSCPSYGETASWLRLPLLNQHYFRIADHPEAIQPSVSQALRYWAEWRKAESQTEVS